MNARWSSLTLESEMTPAELAFLGRVIQERNLNGVHLEVGTGAGGTLRFLLRLHDGRVRFVVVDPMTYFADQRETVLLNITEAGYRDLVEIRETTSAAAYRLSRV